MRAKRVSQAGISMLEVLIASSMVTIVLIPLIISLGMQTKSFVFLRNKMDNANAGVALLETIATKKWDEHTVSPTQYLVLPGSCPSIDVTKASCTLGPETGETGPATFNDIDDFNGYQDTYAGLNRTVTVEYVVVQNNNNNEVLTVSSTPTNAKRVTVTTSTPNNPMGAPYVQIFFDGISY